MNCVFEISNSTDLCFYIPGLHDSIDVCSATITGCNDPEPSGGEPSKFNFKFDKCSTPIATSVSPNIGNTDTSVTILGSGLGSASCPCEVTFGDMFGTEITSTGSNVQIKISPSNFPSIGLLQDLQIKVSELGFAYIDISNPQNRGFALKPSILSINPASGSIAGGTTVTIAGSGFQGNKQEIQVTIGGYDVAVKSVTYTVLVVETPRLFGTQQVEVKVKSSLGTFVTADCIHSCTFSYDRSLTPEMTDAQPLTLTGASTTVTISGAKFGQTTHIDNVTVTIGMEICNVTSVSDVNIECTITNIPAGTNAIMASIHGLGRVKGKATVIGQAVITAVDPIEGSINGGTELVIDGNGFVKGSTTITMDGTPCNIKQITLSQVKCLTPPHVAGSVDMVVSSNRQFYKHQDFTYTDVATPTIDVVNPRRGSAGTVVTLTGSNFATDPDDISVKIGKPSLFPFSVCKPKLIIVLKPFPSFIERRC